MAAGHTVVGTVRSAEDLRAFEGARTRARSRPHPGCDGRRRRLKCGRGGGAERRPFGCRQRRLRREGTFEETPPAEVRRGFEANVFGTVATPQAALPPMRRRRRGHLMAVTSMGGLMAVPGMSAYCGSKFALEGILEALGKEVARFGIHVAAIEPGSFRTGDSADLRPWGRTDGILAFPSHIALYAMTKLGQIVKNCR
ncbi:SDR family NAD(P)-dependent oxidoreductase [Nonomuraea terrae]|uniref:SDR family NAD(P)-dependent oxidoreductase n=1 Tax=Nonomuraea terrae TaxID=2530383 RepID=UPI0024829E76|nr:SDR family NAD(P)-dependent oxidoreductase [Nonomuraea terrae]